MDIERLNKSNQLHFLLIGDLMLDLFTSGECNRISAEAPVPVIDIKSQKYILGGAANISNNLKNLGAKVSIIGCIGNDNNGILLKNMIDNELGNEHFIFTSNRKTTVKNRIFSNDEQVIRIDTEDTFEIDKSEETKILESVSKVCNEESISGIILQDYNKGIFTRSLIVEIIKLAESFAVPVFVDPKEKYFFDYKNVAIFKPNKKELQTAFNDTKSDIRDLAKKCADQISCELILCTMAENGIGVVKNDKFLLVPTKEILAADVSGAGDTTLAVMSIAYVLGYEDDEIALLGNMGGYLACSKPGVSIITMDELKKIAMDWGGE